MLNSFFSKISKSELLSASLGSLAIKVIGMCAGLALVRVVQEYYGADVWGYFTLFLTIANTMGIISALGMGQLALRDISGHFRNDELDYCYSLLKSIWTYILLLAGILTLALYFLNTESITFFIFEKEGLTQYLYYSVLVVPGITLMRLNAEVLRALRRIILFTATQNMIVNVVFAFCAFFLHDRLDNLDLLRVYVLTVYAVVFFQIIVIGFHLNLIKILTAPLLRFKKLFATSRIFYVNGFLFQMNSSIGVFVLTRMSSMEMVGYFDVVLKIATLATIALNAVNGYTAPKFAELIKKNNLSEIQKVLNNANFMMYTLTLPIFLFIMIFPGIALGIFKVSSIHANISLIILGIAQTINTLAGSVGYFMSMTGHEAKFLRYTIISVSLNIVLSLLLVIFFDLIGVCIALAVAIIFVNLRAHYSIRQLYDINTFLVPSGYLKILKKYLVR